MSKFTIQTRNAAETEKIAKQLANLLDGGSVITLEGDLGVGKTTFTKGIANGLGVEQTVSSPTFTIIKEYMGAEFPLYHIDAYRLEHSDEDIGFDEYFFSKSISVIEWAQFIEQYLPDEYLQITITYVDENSRSIQFKPYGKNYLVIIEKLFKQLKE